MTSLAPIIIANAKLTGISPMLIAAVIHQESWGNIYAVRYEPAFERKYLSKKTKSTLEGYVPKVCTLNTEIKLRATSFGCVQLMGQVARERGFKGEFLTELFDPQLNIKLGTEFLQALLLKHESTEKALLRWNGGGDPEYGKKVLRHIDTGDCQYLLCS